MKIIYTGGFRFPNGDAAAARVLANAKILRDFGHQIEFLSWGGEYRENDLNTNGNYVYEGFPYIITHEIDNNKSSSFSRLYSVLNRGVKALKLIKEKKPDVVIAYNANQFFNQRLLKYTQNQGIKLISDITEWYAANEIPGGKWLPFYWVSEFNMKFTHRKIKNRILISEMLDNYYDNGRNIILPPLVDLQEDKWNKEIGTIPFVIKNFRGRKIIFAGNPAKKDLLRNVIEALIGIVKEGAGKNKLQLIILGVKEENFHLYCSNEEMSLLGDSIVNLGRVPQDEVPAYYKIVDASLIIRENNRKNNAGFPTKMAESMASGCPVIMTRTSDLTSYAKDGYNSIIINDESVYSVKDGLNRLINFDSNKLQNMKDNALETGLSKFDYRNYIQAMEVFINSLL